METKLKVDVITDKKSDKNAIYNMVNVIESKIGFDKLAEILTKFFILPTDYRKYILKELISKTDIKSLVPKIKSIKIMTFSNSDKFATKDELTSLTDLFSKIMKSQDPKLYNGKVIVCSILAERTFGPISDYYKFLEPKDNIVDNLDLYSLIEKIVKEAIPIHYIFSDYIDEFSKLFNFTEEQRNTFLTFINLKVHENTYLSPDDVKEESEALNEKIDELKAENKKNSETIKEKNKEVKELKNEIKNNQEYIKKYNELVKEKDELEDIKSKLEEDIDFKNKLVDELMVENEHLKISSKEKPLVLKKTKKKNIDENVFINTVKAYLANKGLCYDSNDIYNFHISVKSSPLTILAGVSGLGKTRLPLAYAECINAKEEDSTLLFLPISPSYTEPSDILGFYNSQLGKYQVASTGFVDFLVHASENKDKMHMVIFDEMNLSQIEYWFAPFMSILEKPVEDRYLHLYSKSLTDEKYTSSIHIGENIIFVGTINLDETTKDLSDRLIDRAIVINLKKQNFIDFYNQEMPKNTDLVVCHNYELYDSMRKEFKGNYIKLLTEREVEFLDKLHNMLQKNNSSKGVSFRNVYKICNYLMEAPNNEYFSRELAFDLIFKQTILKKLNGYDASVFKILGKLDGDSIVDSQLLNILLDYQDVSLFTYTIDEIKNKIKELDNYGFTR